MNSGARYAVYFVPAADHPLYRFGRAVLAYDCYTREDVAHPHSVRLAPAEWAALTREPRVYGFHATLKAPFRLLAPFGEAALTQAFAAFAAARRAIPLIEPYVGMLGSFIAVMPRRRCIALDELAARCVTAFDGFRAPLTREERERRLSAGLGPAEIANLDRWGYPFVFEAFRFHLTLTGPVTSARCDCVLALLQEAFARQCGESAFAIDRVALLRQDHAQARFYVVAQAILNA